VPYLPRPGAAAPEPPAEPLLRLTLSCLRCGRTGAFEFESAFLSPDPEAASRIGWDGVLLPTIVRCPACGAEDDYALNGDTPLVLTAELLKVTSGVPSRVQVALCQLWDGTVVHRSLQGLQRLRALADQQPASGEAWRRLGNYCEKIHRLDEAERAWRRAVEVDADEGEAAFSLAALLAGRGDVPGALTYIGASLERLPRRAELTPEARRQFLQAILEMIREYLEHSRAELALMAVLDDGGTGTEHAVTMSSVSLRRVADWGRLLDILAGGRVFAASLTSDIPAEETILERILAAPQRPSAAARNREKARRKRARR
jgi:hypothetical protein